MPITAEKDLSALLHAIPYARTIGMRAELAGDEMTAILPFQDLLIGNPLLPALHGGVVGAFLEITAVCQLYIAQGQERFPKAIDITIDYLHSGRPRDTYARAIIVKSGRRIANVTAEAW
ncbi:MAG TPA: thioesterase, partial [Hyphomonadaceae bacterium]|nr:thioesterase [Hyphomonadaceae bacterium]